MSRPADPRALGARRRRPRAWPRLSSALLAVLLLALLAACEVAGRAARSDAEDALVVSALLLGAWLLRRRHRREPVGWLRALAAPLGRAREALRRQAVALGVDLRGAPPVAAGTPPLLLAMVGALAAVPVLLLAFPGLDARLLREGARSVSAAGWAAVLGGTWFLLLGGGLYLQFLTFALTHDEFVRAHRGPGPRPRGRETVALFAWPAATLLGWSLLPAWTPLAIQVGCVALALAALALPGGPDLRLLWRRRGGTPGLRSVPWATHTLAATAGVGLLLADGALLLRAGVRAGDAPGAVAGALPLTTLLAALFSWCGAAALLAWTHLVLRTAWLARFRDPGRPGPVPVHVAGAPPAAERRGMAAALAAAGLPARFAPAPPARGAVAVSLREGLAPEALVPWVRRRAELGRRRALLRGLERLFKMAAGRRFAQGHGYWVAPWHWFCVGLSRDEDERAVDWKEGTFFLETIGPAYHRVFPLPVLRHAWEVMHGLEIDLVFVEDGVGFRRLRRVLRMAFELHDMFGGRRRAEEHHFTGIHGVRVLLHAFEMEAPRRERPEAYPEPDYETVGRGRILHVYREREESKDTADAPRDRSGIPVPA